MSIPIEFVEVASGPGQQEIFRATVTVDWDEPFLNVFEHIHRRRHPGHDGSTYKYQYAIHWPGSSFPYIIPPLSTPTQLDLPLIPAIQIWVMPK